MARRPRCPDLSIEDFSVTLDLEPGLIIDFDGETFGRAATNGQMIEEFSRKARAALQFRMLAKTLAHAPAQAPGQRPSPQDEPQAPARASPLAPILDKLRLRA